MSPKRVTKIDVFISYSHDDEGIAARLSRRIRSYKAPRAIKKWKRRLKVFRDVERLTAHPDLSDALSERINEAANLLVLCSPSAAESSYVDQEVKTFIEEKGTSAVILVLVDGMPEESFPPAIMTTLQEPLYIDLRPTGRLVHDWHQFRKASLRVIAALIGVDFAELIREDERRRSRLRWSFTTAAVTISLGLGSVYFVDQVPADTWKKISLPTHYYESSLLPVKDYAVYIPDPDIRLFLVYGAEFAAQQPEFPIALFGGYSAGFVKQTEQFLRTEKDFESLSRSVATLSFDLVFDPGAVTRSRSDTRSVMGRGELRIFAHLGPKQRAVVYGGVLHYEELLADSSILPHQFPPSQMNPKNPLGLSPWPTNVLNQSGVLPPWGYLEGKLKTAWEDTVQVVSYEINDVEETFWEGNDGQWIEQGLITDGDETREAFIAGVPQKLQDLEYEQWQTIIDDPGWAVYETSNRGDVEKLMIYQAQDGTLRVQGGEVDDAIVALIENTPGHNDEIYYRITHIISHSTGSSPEIVQIVPYQYDEIAERKNLHESYTLVRKNANADWLTSEGIGIESSTNIIDAFVINGKSPAILVLTDKEGLFLSQDDGVSWEEFNHGEAALLIGSSLRPVITGKPEGIYILSVDYCGEQQDCNNQLFRYAIRSWQERLRLGLIELLQGNLNI